MFVLNFWQSLFSRCYKHIQCGKCQTRSLLNPRKLEHTHLCKYDPFFQLSVIHGQQQNVLKAEALSKYCSPSLNYAAAYAHTAITKSIMSVHGLIYVIYCKKRKSRWYKGLHLWKRLMRSLHFHFKNQNRPVKGTGAKRDVCTVFSLNAKKYK